MGTDLSISSSAALKGVATMNQTTRILMVDDDPQVVRLCSTILGRRGYQVWEANTGQQGREMAQKLSPDLVLLDVMLPDMNGREVCRQIKANPSLTDVFVIMFSGEATSV